MNIAISTIEKLYQAGIITAHTYSRLIEAALAPIPKKSEKQQPQLEVVSKAA